MTPRAKKRALAALVLLAAAAAITIALVASPAQACSGVPNAATSDGARRKFARLIPDEKRRVITQLDAHFVALCLG